MCGLAGIAVSAGSPPPTEATLGAMVGALHHRGPDGSRVRINGRVGLTHARLSIVDLEGGWQPMGTADGGVQVVFNGEIFNHVELRAEMQRQGHVFSSNSDTEVILHLYERHGDDFAHHLNGQFAIALHDVRRQRLILVRDRVGIRPLYYHLANGRLAFASEIKALHAIGVPLEFDSVALGEIFGFWAPLGERTSFKNVKQLLPGHRMAVDLRDATLSPHIERYWQWEPKSGPGADADEDALADELHALLVDAVRLQLRADVPLGGYLSGGLDSSAITALASRDAGTDLRTFSLAFDDPEYDERAFQRLMARELGTCHSEIAVTKEDIASAFTKAVIHAEMPLVRTAPVPMLLLAGHVHDSGYKVVLTGEGADEVFAGYDLFKEAQAKRFVARQPGSRFRGRIFERLYPYLAHSPARSSGFAARFFREDGDASAPWFAHASRVKSTRRVLRFLHPDLRMQVEASDPLQALAEQVPVALTDWAALERDQYVEAITLLPGYLLAAQGDRMAMACSVEGRYPFLDHRVIEFANSLPPTFKLRGLREKRLLKRAMRNVVPDTIIQRHKQPYRSPDSQCFFRHGRVLPWVEELLAPDRLSASGLFDVAAVGHLVGKCRNGRAIGYPDNMAFVGVLSLSLLHAHFVQSQPVSMT